MYRLERYVTEATVEASVLFTLFSISHDTLQLLRSFPTCAVVHVTYIEPTQYIALDVSKHEFNPVYSLYGDVLEKPNIMHLLNEEVTIL